MNPTKSNNPDKPKIYPTGIARANAWAALTLSMSSTIGSHCKFTEDGYLETYQKPAHFVNYMHLRKPVMGMRLDEYLFYFLDDTRVRVDVMSNAASYMVTGDATNLNVELAGITVDIGGAIVTPMIPRKYPDDVEAKLYSIWQFLFALDVEMTVKG